jgi:hypothetical protein
VTHFLDVFFVIAADAPDAAHGKLLGAAGNGNGSLWRLWNDETIAHMRLSGLRK